MKTYGSPQGFVDLDWTSVSEEEFELQLVKHFSKYAGGIVCSLELCCARLGGCESVITLWGLQQITSHDGVDGGM